MKKWCISIVLSTLISLIGLWIFIWIVARDTCLNTGGSWHGLIQGCKEGAAYSLSFLNTPLAIVILITLVFSIASAFVQLYTIMIKHTDKTKRY